MAHGHRDWGGYASTSTIHLLQDMGELAARLGSIVTFDRRGNVLFFDDFQTGLSRWSQGTVGAASSIYISLLTGLWGPYSIGFTAGPNAGDLCSLNRYFAYPVPSRIGLELASTLHSDVGNLYLNLAHRNDDETVRFRVRYLGSTDAFQYLDSAGAYQDLATGLGVYTGSDQFHHFKLVVDLTDNTYVRAIMDNHEYDLADIEGYNVAHGPGVLVGTLISLESSGAASSVVNLGGVIITQNEP